MKGGDDPFFGPPYIDEDVWEDVGVRHRYVHGGFEGTDTRFAFYFPEAQHYTGRFIQFLEGAQGGHEGKEAHPDGFLDSFLKMSASHGAYFVECNTGHIDTDDGPDDRTVSAYRANAQSARYARQLAEEMYGAAPHHGYLVGGSSGGIRSIVAMEHVDDVWDGSVPFVVGPLTSFTVGASMELPRMVNAGGALSLLRPEARASVLDAVETGGGDPFADLDDFEREVIDALFASGFQREALFQHSGQAMLNMIVPIWITMPLVRDPAFVDDFWNAPGYAGADGEMADRALSAEATVKEIRAMDELVAAGITDHPLTLMGDAGRGLVAEGGWPSANSTFATLTVTSGKDAGEKLTCWSTFGDVLVVSGGGDLASGDRVSIDNHAFLAAAMYFRYQDQREASGAAGPLTDYQTPGGYLPTGMSGRFHGKMLMFNATLDVMAPTGGAVLYDELVHEAYGEAVDDKFRLWWVDNTCHTGLPMGPPGPPAPEARAVMYGGVMQEAVRCLIEWVEDDVEPPASSAYRFENGQVELPAKAADRRGVQPVATAAVEGGRRIEVAAGTAVTFDVLAEAPPQGGCIIDVAWDFDGSGKFACAFAVDGTSATVRLATTHTFDRPGTYFPAVRVTSERNGAMDATLGRMENLDRVRVVVT